MLNEFDIFCIKIDKIKNKKMYVCDEKSFYFLNFKIF